MPGARGEGVDFGVVVADKPRGPTSHDVVDWVRWSTRQRAVGHCGTLDPMATGVLVLCLGKATRLVEQLTAADKTYEATFVLGRSTDTADAEGETLARATVTADDLARAAVALQGLVGTHQLSPPAYSAVKVGGTRAHELARAGAHVELAARPMAVLELGPVRPRHAPATSDPYRLDVVMRVSKGTYVRSLAVALGRALALPVHLGALRRTAAGAVDLSRALSPLEAERLAPPADAGGAESPAAGRRRAGPKWRIRPPGGGGRDACAALLEASVLDPFDALGWRSLDADDDPAVAAAAGRLSQGQRLGLRDPAVTALVRRGLPDGGARLDGAPDPGGDAGGPGDVAGHFVLRGRGAERAAWWAVAARVEYDAERGWRVAPAKVLRW